MVLFFHNSRVITKCYQNIDIIFEQSAGATSAQGEFTENFWRNAFVVGFIYGFCEFSLIRFGKNVNPRLIRKSFVGVMKNLMFKWKFFPGASYWSKLDLFIEENLESYSKDRFNGSPFSEGKLMGESMFRIVYGLYDNPLLNQDIADSLEEFEMWDAATKGLLLREQMLACCIGYLFTKRLHVEFANAEI